MKKTTPIYELIINKTIEMGGDGKLQEKVWNPTPWVIDVYLGEMDDDRIEYIAEKKLRDWCNSFAGKESWPIHDRPGDWYRAGFTADGWTWIGFKTEEMMDEFIMAWPEHVKLQQE